jgi:hypothetical protein
MIMKKTPIIVTALLIGVTLAGAGFVAVAKDVENDALAARDLKVSIEQAVQIALSKVPGTLVKAEVDNEKGQLIWEIEVLDVKQQSVDFEIDAKTGAVIKQQADVDDLEDEEDEDDDEENE